MELNQVNIKKKKMKQKLLVFWLQMEENLGCKEKAYKHCKPFSRVANKNVKRKKARRPLRISMQVRQVHRVLIKRCRLEHNLNSIISLKK